MAKDWSANVSLNGYSGTPQLDTYPVTFRHDMVNSRCAWTPFDSITLPGLVTAMYHLSKRLA